MQAVGGDELPKGHRPVRADCPPHLVLALVQATRRPGDDSFDPTSTAAMYTIEKVTKKPKWMITAECKWAQRSNAADPTKVRLERRSQLVGTSISRPLSVASLTFDAPTLSQNLILCVTLQKAD